METLRLATVLQAEEGAKAMGPTHVEALREAAIRWLQEAEAGLCLELGVREALERITATGTE